MSEPQYYTNSLHFLNRHRSAHHENAMRRRWNMALIQN
jgi:hypothetical protein